MSDSASACGSRAASAGPEGSSPKSLQEKVERYRRQLMPSVVMGQKPEASGRVLWQAGQTLGSLKKRDASSYECVMLTAYIEGGKKAVQLADGMLQKLPVAKRRCILEEFKAEGVQFPAELQGNLIAVICKEASLADAAHRAAFLDILCPVLDEPAFDPLKPRLGQATLQDQRRAQILQTTCVEALIRMVQKGKAHVADTVAFAEDMMTALQPFWKDDAGFLSVVISEILALCKCLVAIGHPVGGVKGTSLADVDAIWQSNGGGRRVLKQAGFTL